MLPEISFPNLKKHAREMMSIFSSTYLCEQTFSKMKYVKSKSRTNLSDKHLQATLLIVTIKFKLSRHFKKQTVPNVSLSNLQILNYKN